MWRRVVPLVFLIALLSYLSPQKRGQSEMERQSTTESRIRIHLNYYHIQGKFHAVQSKEKSLQHVSKQGQVRLLTLARDVTRQFSPGVQPEFPQQNLSKFFNRRFFFFFSLFVGCHARRHIITPPLPSLKDDLSLSLCPLSCSA